MKETTVSYFGERIMKVIFVALFALFSQSFAQVNLSTPGGNSVVIVVDSVPSGAELYVANTFIGRTPTLVEINANTPTTFVLRMPNSQNKIYEQSLYFDTNDSITINVSEPNQLPLTPLPTPPSSTPSAPTTTAPTSVRAYRDIFFGMTSTEVMQVISQDTDISPTDDFLLFDVAIAGNSFKMLPEFNEDLLLVRLIFESQSVEPLAYDSKVKLVASELSNFLTRAYGEPTRRLPIPEYFSLRDAVTVVTLWENQTEDKVALIGIVNEEYNYYVRFVVLQDSLFNAAQDDATGDF